MNYSYCMMAVLTQIQSLVANMGFDCIRIRRTESGTITWHAGSSTYAVDNTLFVFVFIWAF